MKKFFEDYRYEDFSIVQWIFLFALCIIYIPLSIVLAVSFLLYRVVGWNEQYYGVEAKVNNFSTWYFDDFLNLPIRY